MDGCKKKAEGGKVLTWRVLSHLEMQWKWKAWLHLFKQIFNNCIKCDGRKARPKPKYVSDRNESHIPQATVHSSLVAEAWLA